jgi:hypothetical protein
LFTLLDVSLWGQFIYIGIYGVLGDWQKTINFTTVNIFFFILAKILNHRKEMTIKF